MGRAPFSTGKGRGGAAALAMVMVAAALSFAPAAHAADDDLMINEIMAENDSTSSDEDRDFSDWIEIHNPTNSAIDTDGYVLSDRADFGEGWTLPSRSIPAGGYLVVWASGKDRVGTELHASFRLSNNGDYLGLRNAAGATISEFAPEYPKQSADISFGFYNGKVGFMADPTPGEANTSTVSMAAPDDPVSSVARGVHDSAIEVELTSTPGSVIYYTIDGTIPNPDNGLIAPKVLPISSSTALMARSYHAQAANPSDVVAYTWVILDHLLGADGGLDQQVVSANEGKIRDSFDQLITISLAVPQGVDGIDVARSDDRAEGLVEFIHPAGVFSEQALVQAYKFGGLSMGFEKASIRFRFDHDDGPNKLRVDLFNDLDRPGVPAATEFDALELRSGGTTDSVFGAAVRRDSAADAATHIANRFFSESMLALGNDNPHGRYAHVFINGDYRGVNHLREFMNGHFSAAYNGGDIEDNEAVKATLYISGGPPRAVTGDGSVWERISVLTARTSYSELLTRLDVPAYIDSWLMGVMFVSEREWRASGPVDPANPGGYVTFVNDTDGALSHRTEDTSPDWGYNGQDGLFAKLWSAGHPDFRVLVADRITEAFFGDGALTPESIGARFDFWQDRVSDSLHGEIARWAEHLRDAREDPMTLHDDWVAAMVGNRELAVGRNSATLPGLRSRGYLPLDPVESSHGSGAISAATVVSLTNPNSDGDIVYTTDGADPRVSGDSLADSATVSTGDVALRIDEATRIVARPRNGSTWGGKTTFDYKVVGQSSPAQIVINELSAQNASVTGPDGDTPDWIELHNPTSWSVQLTDWSIADASDSWRIPATLLEAGDYLVIWATGGDLGSDGESRADLALRGGGETLRLLDPFGRVVDELDPFPSQRTDATWGRSPDGDFVALLEPTAGGANAAPGPASGDLDCDDLLTLLDTLSIAQLVDGGRSDSGRCPIADAGEVDAAHADFNADANVDDSDVLIALSCLAQLSDQTCPNTPLG